MSGPAAFAVAAAALLLAAAGVFLGRTGPTVAGSSGVSPNVVVATLRPHESVCLPDQRVPAGADRVRFVLGTYNSPRETVSVQGTAGDRTVLNGSKRFSSGPVTVPFSPAAPVERRVRLCVRNRSAGRLAIAGHTGFGETVTSSGRRTQGTLSLTYPATNGPTWLDEAGAIARRFDHVRWAPFGPGTAWVALALALGAVAGAVTLTLRGARGD